MSKKNSLNGNKIISALKSKFFLKLFFIPAGIWIIFSLICMIDQSDSEPITWKESIAEDLIILVIWFGISFLITIFHKKKEVKDLKMGRIPEKKWKEKTTFKKILFPLIMSIITFLIGILLSYDSFGYPFKAKLIIFLLAFLPCILFLLFIFIIYKNKENKIIYTIFKIFSIVNTCLLLAYYFLAIFFIVLTEAINPMTNPKYYSFYKPNKTVFPQKIPKDVEAVKFLYAPGILQGGTRYSLYYIDKKMTLTNFDKKYKEQAEWVGHIDEYKEKPGLLSSAFYSTPSKYKNENDYVIYLINSKCDDSGWCNHGFYMIAAFNEKTHQVVYSSESW